VTPVARRRLCFAHVASYDQVVPPPVNAPPLANTCQRVPPAAYRPCKDSCKRSNSRARFRARTGRSEVGLSPPRRVADRRPHSLACRRQATPRRHPPHRAGPGRCKRSW